MTAKSYTYTYFVAYFWSSQHGSSGHGNITLDLDAPLDSIETIRQIQRHVDARLGTDYRSVVTGFQLLTGLNATA